MAGCLLRTEWQSEDQKPYGSLRCFKGYERLAWGFFEEVAWEHLKDEESCVKGVELVWPNNFHRNGVGGVYGWSRWPSFSVVAVLVVCVFALLRCAQWETPPNLREADKWWEVFRNPHEFLMFTKGSKELSIIQ